VRPFHLILYSITQTKVKCELMYSIYHAFVARWDARRTTPGNSSFASLFRHHRALTTTETLRRGVDTLLCKFRRERKIFVQVQACSVKRDHVRREREREREIASLSSVFTNTSRCIDRFAFAFSFLQIRIPRGIRIMVNGRPVPLKGNLYPI